MKEIFLILSFLLLSACVHQHKVEDPIDSKDGEGTKVGIGSLEVSEGETVRIVRVTCRDTSIRVKGRANRACKKEELGRAKILKILSEDSSLARPLDELILLPDMTVEKIGGHH